MLKVFGYDWLADIVVTVAMALFFAATSAVTGLMIGIASGVMFSVVLWCGKQYMGYQKLERNRLSMRWKTYPPTWSKYYGS